MSDAKTLYALVPPYWLDSTDNCGSYTSLVYGIYTEREGAEAHRREIIDRFGESMMAVWELEVVEVMINPGLDEVIGKFITPKVVQNERPTAPI